MVDKQKRKEKPKGVPSRTRWVLIMIGVLAAIGFLGYALYTPPIIDAPTLQKVQSHQAVTTTPDFGTQTRDLLLEQETASGAQAGVQQSGTGGGSLPDND